MNPVRGQIVVKTNLSEYSMFTIELFNNIVINYGNFISYL